jgi:Family of unknown function (DUF6412)
MIDVIGAIVRLLLAALGVTSATSASSLSVCAVLLAAALVIALVHSVHGPLSPRASLRRADGAIDVSVLLCQSDPDAAGHPRSRAPGLAASAA